MTKTGHFSRQLFQFLKALRRNNNREWFQENKALYESLVRDPLLRFIAELSPGLLGISRHLLADPRPAGGSMFRIYRDVRFSNDKSPYKTHAAAQFRHRRASRDVHAPGFYLHLEPGQCFGGAGLWRPDSQTLLRVRTAIASQSAEWRAVRRAGLELEGESLTRPPKGFDPSHPFIEDLRRKDFIAGVSFTEHQVCASNFLSRYLDACHRMSPLMKFLTQAVDLPW